jgi:hypothetical protein
MTKNKQRSNNNTKHIITEEYLEKLNDYELKRVFIDVRSLLNRARRNRSRTKDIEIDYCYVQKEIQCRQGRKQQKNKV